MLNIRVRDYGGKVTKSLEIYGVGGRMYNSKCILCRNPFKNLGEASEHSMGSFRVRETTINGSCVKLSCAGLGRQGLVERHIILVSALGMLVEVAYAALNSDIQNDNRRGSPAVWGWIRNERTEL